MRICVMGTGYVGLVAGACFSDSGNHVCCVDVNEQKIADLNKGKIPIYEPGLEEIIKRNVLGKRLAFSTDSADSIGNAEIIFVAVGTPSAEDGSLDLRYVYEVAKTVKEHAKNPLILVLKSTVPVGTADQVREILKGCKVQVDVVSNPEFLKEGTAINDFLKPERVIIGSEKELPAKIIAELYSPHTRSGNPILFMSNRSAELTKYAANTFLATKISFVNELALLSEKVGADIYDVRKGLITDSRIGNKFLYPGCGYGGSCFPKDVQAYISLGKGHGLEMEISSAAHSVNERQKDVLFEKLRRHYRDKLKGKTIAIWGLSFKPMTDDMREAPALALIKKLIERGCTVKGYDPVALTEARRHFETQIELFDDAYDALKNADSLAILTEWNEFRSPDFSRIQRELKDNTVFDGRNLYAPDLLGRYGLKYYCIGRPDPS